MWQSLKFQLSVLFQLKMARFIATYTRIHMWVHVYEDSFQVRLPEEGLYDKFVRVLRSYDKIG